MKILIPEKFNQAGIDVLEEAGYEVTYKPDTTAEELVEIIPAYDALIVRSATTVTREVIEAGKNLKIVGRAGVGVDNIDREAATERGIIVCNAPLSNVVSAAEQTMALMLAAARNTAAASASMKEGKWDRSKFTGIELQDKTLGIFGTGHVGLLVAERAAAFGMKLIGYDPYCPPERAAHYGITLLDSVDDVCKQADFITLHMPKTPETTGMIGAAQMAEMPEGAIILNVARGGLVDLDALADALESGHIRACGIDVWEHEPVSDSPIHKFDQATITPHLGASTKEAQVRAATQIAEYVIAGLEGKTVATAVNAARVPADVMAQLKYFIPVAQRGGEILAQVVGGGIDKLRVTACGKIAETDPTVLGTAALAGGVTFNSEVPVNIINAGYIAEQRGITVETATDPLSESYPSYIQIVASCGKDEYSIAVTRDMTSDMPRIINFMGLPVDFVPSKDFVVLEYADQPGQIGKVGTVFGDANINVESMQIAKDSEHPLVEVLINLNQPVPQDVRQKLESTVDTNRIWYIDL